MLIHYMSDLHLEFGALNKPLPEGDVLLLAGDTTVVKYLQPHRHDAEARSLQKATQRLNDEIARKFARAYAVVGNHEAYGSVYAYASEALARALPAVTVLDCDHVKLSDDVVLFGAPLWTDMDRGNPLSMLAIKNGMTDFNLIETPSGARFTPEMAAAEFHKTVAYLGKLAEAQRDKAIVVMTHHAPSRLGLDQHNRDYPNVLDGAYCSNLEYFIESHPNIRYWVHGHTHVQQSYEIAQCKVFANCRGYFQRQPPLWKSFDPNASFDIERMPAAAELALLDNDF